MILHLSPKHCVVPIDKMILADSLTDAHAVYKQLGENDKAAKGSKMRDAVLAKIQKRIASRRKVAASAG